LEESNEDEEDENFELYVSDDEKINETSPDDDKNLDFIPFMQEELREPPKLQIIEKALIHDLPKYVIEFKLEAKRKIKIFVKKYHPEKLQEYADKIEEMEDRNDSPDKKSDIEDDKSIDNKEDLNIKNNENQMSHMKPTIIDIQTFKGNVIDIRDLLFLRKDNIAYFDDINGKPLDSGSQKLFERNEISNLGSLTLRKAKTIKYKKYYHIARQRRTKGRPKQ